MLLDQPLLFVCLPTFFPFLLSFLSFLSLLSFSDLIHFIYLLEYSPPLDIKGRLLNRNGSFLFSYTSFFSYSSQPEKVRNLCRCECSVVSDSLPPMDYIASQPSLSWDFPGQNPGGGFHTLLQGIFPTKGLNLNLLHLLHRQADSLPLRHLGRSNLMDLFIGI